MNVSRSDYESAVAHWRALGEGHVEERRLATTSGDIMMATLVRRCLTEEAIHVARQIEVQAMLADGSHYGRSAWADEVIFTIYLSRVIDEQDSFATDEEAKS